MRLGVTTAEPLVVPPVEKLVPVQDVASVDVHESVELSPAPMDCGLAERTTVGGGGSVVALALVDCAELLPAASYAETV